MDAAAGARVRTNHTYYKPATVQRENMRDSRGTFHGRRNTDGFISVQLTPSPAGRVPCPAIETLPSQERSLRTSTAPRASSIQHARDGAISCIRIGDSCT